MNFSKGESILICVLFFTIGFFGAFQTVAPNQHPHQDGGGNGDHGWILGWSPDQWIAFLTLVITAATVIQIFLWRRANQTAEAAVGAAKNANTTASDAVRVSMRALEIQGEAERGRLMVSQPKLNGTTTTEKTPVVDYGLWNVGRTPVVMLKRAQWALMISQADLDPRPAALAARESFEYYPIPANADIRSDRGLQNAVRVEDYTQQGEHNAEDGRHLLLQGYVVYRTAYGLFRATYASIYQRDSKAFAPIIRFGFNSDLPEPEETEP